MKRTHRSSRRGTTGRKRSRIKEIKCNRPDWRKVVIGRKDVVKFKHRGTKIKSKEFERIKKE